VDLRVGSVGLCTFAFSAATATGFKHYSRGDISGCFLYLGPWGTVIMLPNSVGCELANKKQITNYLKRAQELLAIALRLNDGEAKEVLVQCAYDYMRLAKAARSPR
jgi:hypothetical protein